MCFNSFLYRYIYLGLPAGLRGVSFFPAFLTLILLRKRHLPGENDSAGTELADAKTAEHENECKGEQQNAKVPNAEELKTKL